MLLPFLRSSQHYTLEKVWKVISWLTIMLWKLFNLLNFQDQFQAYNICVKKELIKEQVFILGRMGNSKQALAVIINDLGDIEEVNRFFV